MIDGKYRETMSKMKEQLVNHRSWYCSTSGKQNLTFQGEEVASKENYIKSLDFRLLASHKSPVTIGPD